MTLTSRDRRRNGVWNSETAGPKMEHVGLMMGGLAACPDGPCVAMARPSDA